MSDSPNEGLRQRLAQVAERYSQSEIARRTGTPRNNVCRYLRGTKMPLEFGVALSEELGINPTWLLRGEGAPWLADAGVHNEKMAGDLLELVEAMNAVARMRLGSLTGKHHLRVLRELNDALLRYEGLREQLNVKTSPIFEELIGQYQQALGGLQLDRSDDLRRALTQLARLNDDAELRTRFDAFRAYHEYILGHASESIDIQRDVLFHSLSRGGVTEQSLDEAYNLAMSLYRLFRHPEACRILKATFDLMPPGLESAPQAIRVEGLLGVLEIDMGDVPQGFARLQRAAAFQPELYLGHSGGFLVRAQLMLGLTTLEAAMSLGTPSLSRNTRIVQWAAWLEDPALLKRVIRECIGTAPHHMPESFVYAGYVRALLQAIEGNPDAARKYVDEDTGSTGADVSRPIVRFAIPASYCRLARVAGDRQRALKFLKEADRHLHEIPPEYTLDVMAAATHYRNALLLISENTRGASLAKIRARAQQFFRESAAKGFGCFMQYVTSHAA
ncbi:MAG: helix-turn-helix transcriptional regulator [Planctomycetes bacterium]|nr:helix-turn-helix transcriptional regulator [Planctomycetota bacterium]